MPTTSEHPRFVDVAGPSYPEPLTPTVKRALLALVIFFHVGGGWALTQVEPVKLVVGDIAPMEVRMVPAEQLAQPDPPLDEPPPLPEVPPPPPELATMVEPPPPDLPAAGLSGRGTAAQATTSAGKAQTAAAQAGAEAATDTPGARRGPAAAGRTGGASRAQDRNGLAIGVSRAAQPDLSDARA
jgi:hypothetical protein